MIHEGHPAPDFSLPDQHGRLHRLADYRGKHNVVVFFYPKDNTPGCTREACSFRDAHTELQGKDAVLLGVSADSPESHQNFASKHHLPYPLLSDQNHSLIKEWEVWGEKSFFGRRFHGILRVTVIVDKQGIVYRIFRNIRKLDEHGEQVLAALEELKEL